MSKVITILHIPEPKIRKSQANATKKHADKSKYTRKTKHKTPNVFYVAQSSRMDIQVKLG